MIVATDYDHETLPSTGGSMQFLLAVVDVIQQQ